ncbi:lysoplasmalogenase [Specibacter cremeus]|uniref:lysoplasmalogenase n=1 Tax=Specibacter cremeus TaxID=1629051 RepID=UPI000F7A67D3|nr:lysoplasmalogenase [Specibacter cremeus]
MLTDPAAHPATVWLILAACLAIADWLLTARHRIGPRAISKPGTMVLLLGAALTMAGTAGWTVGAALITAGLFCSLWGDVFLLRERPGSRFPWFPAGAAAFGLAHLLYAAAFIDLAAVRLADGTTSPEALFAAAVTGVLTVGAAVVLVGRRIVAAAGKERALAAGYVALISLMAATAIGTANAWAVAGALLFYASDSILAWKRYRDSVRLRDWHVMVTYHLAQFSFVGLLAFG